MITIDGSKGGGQILRSSLTLSMLTGQAFRITDIRGQRSKPGLKRQHLACVNAAVEVSGGAVDGATLNSSEVVFSPVKSRGGDYQFAISTAGSTMLVLQTVLLPLLRASQPSRVVLTGGTHNPMAPTFDFVNDVYLPLLTRMGARVSAELVRHGFAPAGGGEVVVEIKPSELQPLHLRSRGESKKPYATILSAHIEPTVAKRESAFIAKKLAVEPEQIAVIQIEESDGPGNVVMIGGVCEEVNELVTAFGERGRSSETVANDAVKEWTRYRNSDAVVGRHLADQLLLPLALAGGGSFLALPLSNHVKTNLDVIQAFLPLEARTTEAGSHTVLVELTS